MTRDFNKTMPPLYGDIDNAITAAFRTVFGWCPFHDGVPVGTRIRRDKGKGLMLPTKAKKPLSRPYYINERDRL